jgi:hypothetical protein
MRILTFVSTFFFLSLSGVSAVHAEAYRCVGLDGTGAKINVLYDEGTNTVNINGEVLKVESGTHGNNGVATENYELEDGTEVYASLVVEDKGKIILRQYKAKNDEVLATVPLACE